MIQAAWDTQTGDGGEARRQTPRLLQPAADVAVADETGRPSAGRGVGFHVLENREAIEVIFSAWQWPRLEPSIRQTGRIATTFVSPCDYVSGGARP